jgi:PAS domain S-box-containing protein
LRGHMVKKNINKQKHRPHLVKKTARVKSKKNLHTYKARQQNIIHNLTSGIVVHAPDTRILFCNPKASELLGLSEDQLKGKTAIDPAWCFIREDGSPLPLEEYPVNRVLTTKQPIKAMVVGVNRPATGDIVWVLVNAYPEFDVKKQLLQAVVMFVDISEYKIAEAEIRHLNKVYAALSQVNHAVSRFTTREELLPQICRAMVEYGGFKMAWIGFFDPDTKKVNIVAKVGDKTGYLDQISVYADERPEGRGPTGTAIRTGKPSVVNNFLINRITVPWNKDAAAAGFKSSAAFPIRFKGDVCGALNVYAAEPNFFQEKEINLLEEVVTDISFALDNMEMKEQHTRAEARLKKEVERNIYLLNLYRKTYSLTDKQLYDYTLNKAVSLTDSQIGFFYLISEDQKNVVFTAWNAETMKNLTAIHDNHYLLNKEENWIDCVRQKKTVIYNAFVNLPNQKGLPQGQVQIKRFMSVPVVEDGKVRLVFGLGNKIEPYEYHDAVQIQLVANDLQKIIVQRRAENALKQSLAELKELNMLKTNFIAMVSHELRTPLTAIKGFTAFLSAGVGGEMTEKQKDFVSSIKNNTERQLILVNDLLDISKIESGVFQIKKEPVDIVSITDKAINDMLPVFTDKEIQVVKKYGENKIEVNIDAYRISQVVINLINNAMRHIPKKSIIEIGIKTAVAGQLPEFKLFSDKYKENTQCVLFYVKDPGEGIEKKNLKRIFDRFYQEGSEKKLVDKGAGLGLYVSQSIINAHGGAIWAESEGKDRGTVIKFVIPVNIL